MFSMLIISTIIMMISMIVVFLASILSKKNYCSSSKIFSIWMWIWSQVFFSLTFFFTIFF